MSAAGNVSSRDRHFPSLHQMGVLMVHASEDTLAVRSRPKGVIGSHIRHYHSVTSTNDVLRELIVGGSGHGTVVVADVQTAGRGRRQRSWQASPGSALLLSVYCEGMPSHVAMMAAGLAVGSAILAVTGLECELKWPNDVLVHGRKVCGILGEQQRDGVTLGMGINVNMEREEAASIGSGATSLMLEHARVSRRQLLEELLDTLEFEVRRARSSPAECFAVWRSKLTTLGQQVEVREDRTVWHGEAVDVAPDGSLLVTRGKQVVRVYAADVSIRPA